MPKQKRIDKDSNEMCRFIIMGGMGCVCVLIAESMHFYIIVILMIFVNCHNEG